MNDWSRAERHAEKAHEFYQDGQWDKALRELRREKVRSCRVSCAAR